MRKICLLFVLSIISVFSISAQTNPNTVTAIGLIKEVKISSDTAENKSIAPSDDQGQEIQLSSTADISESLLQMIDNRSLGEYTTGNETIDSYIENACIRYDIDPLLIFAQMNQESRFKQRALSHKGASGLMQLMPDTAKRFGVKNIYNPKQNIEAGVKYMRWLLNKFGDLRLALAGYNAGEGAVMKYGNKIPPYRETQDYVAKIMAHYEQITNQTSIPFNPNNQETNETTALMP